MSPKFVLLPLFLMAVPAIAQTVPSDAGQPAAAPAQGVTADPADKVVCKTKVPTGSRLGGKKMCMSKRDWAERAKEDQKALSDHISRQSAAGYGL